MTDHSRFSVRAPLPPAARQKPKIDTVHGDRRMDDYFWLRDQDDPDVMAIAVEIFRGLGYDAVTAGNTSDALALLENNEDVQIMFSDVVMPNGPNGVELARRARRLRPDLPILLTSGYPQRALAGDLSDLSDFHFIAKPYRAADVAAQVHDLRRESPRGEGPRTG